MPSKKTVQLLVAGGALVGLGVATGCGLDAGSLCSVCPIGLGQVLLGGAPVLATFGVVLAAVVLVGILTSRKFCNWLCPSNLAKGRRFRAFGKKLGRNVALPPEDGALAAGSTVTGACSGCAACGGCAAADESAASSSGSAIGRAGLRAAVPVAAVLAVSLLVGFPVFCLICPLGLAFGMVFALVKTFALYQPTWDLVVIPLLLLVEFRFLRSWCSRICPIGTVLGFLGLVGKKLGRARRRVATNGERPVASPFAEGALGADVLDGEVTPMGR